MRTGGGTRRFGSMCRWSRSRRTNVPSTYLGRDARGQGCVRGGLDGAVAVGPVGVAEAALVELAVRVAWQLGHVVDAPGQLEPGQPAVEEREQVRGERGAGLRAGRRLDHGLDL